MTDLDRVTLRVPEELFEELDDIADRRHGGNRSAAVRSALETLLAGEALADGGETPDGASRREAECERLGAGDCEYCGESIADTPYYVEFEYPAESDEDPGYFSGEFCRSCSDAVATNILVDRAVTRGLESVYDDE